MSPKFNSYTDLVFKMRYSYSWGNTKIYPMGSTDTDRYKGFNVKIFGLNTKFMWSKMTKQNWRSICFPPFSQIQHSLFSPLVQPYHWPLPRSVNNSRGKLQKHLNSFQETTAKCWLQSLYLLFEKAVRRCSLLLFYVNLRDSARHDGTACKHSTQVGETGREVRSRRSSLATVTNQICFFSVGPSIFLITTLDFDVPRTLYKTAG